MLGNLEIALIAGAAVLLFGADRLPKLGRSFGEMRKEFTRGQNEAESPTPTGTASPAATTIATQPSSVATNATPVDVTSVEASHATPPLGVPPHTVAHDPLAKESERP